MARASKDAQPLDLLRNQLTSQQRALIDHIWSEQAHDHQGLVQTVLFLQHGGPSIVRPALNELGGTVVLAQPARGNSPPTFCLTLVGALLTTDGPHLEHLLASLFQHARESIQRNPERRQFSSGELVKSGRLASEDCMLLGQLLRLHSRHFQWGGSYSIDGWEAQIPEDTLEVLLDTPDIPAFVGRTIASEYETKSPIEFGQHAHQVGVWPPRSAGTQDPDAAPRRDRTIFCNSCSRETKHELLIHHEKSVAPEAWGSGLRIEFELCSCRGCESCVLREVHTLLPVDSMEPIEILHPPRLRRRFPDWINSVDDKSIQDLVYEVYRALGSESRRLALMGCRAILDVYIARLGGVGRRFSEQVDDLVTRSKFSKEQGEWMKAAFDAGSASMHRGYEPTRDNLEKLLDIVEHALRADLIPDAVVAVKKSTPPRPKEPKD